MTDADETRFADFVRDWLAENIEPRAVSGSHMTGDPDARRRLDEENRANQRKIYAAGLAGISVPIIYGGQGKSERYQDLFNKQARAYGLRAYNPTGFATILSCASEAFKIEHVPAILRGDEVWSLLLSEPTGGSDLAGVLTSARREGDRLVVNGQKVWSSGAQFADFGLCLVRTDAEVPKHQGLTMLAIPLRAPGVTVRPIVQATGDSDFSEVFLDDAEISIDNVIGEINDGWAVTTVQLSEERSTAGTAGRIHLTDELVRYLQDRGSSTDSRSADLVAETFVRSEVERHLVQRVSDGVADKSMPAGATALIKMVRTWRAQQNALAALEICELSGIAWNGSDADATRWDIEYLGSRSLSIGGGTAEMLRNIISERVLGLPKEARADLHRPFNETLRNTLPPVPGSTVGA